MRSTGPDNRTRQALSRERLASAIAAARARLRSQGGSMLIEVMVGAVVLAIATTAVLEGVDGAQETGARNRARSVAAALAQQDQERMRAMRVSDLVGYSATRTVNVRGVDYSVTSTASWAVDNGGVVSCSNSSKTSANIRILSEVTSPLTRGTVDQVSLVTPPAGTFAIGQGRAVVKVVDRAQAPIQGATVQLNGQTSASGTTNALGCVVFPFVAIGNYTAAVSGLNLVDWQGNSPAIKALGVAQSQSTLVMFEMDKKATLNVSFDTKVGSATAVAARSQWATLSNSKMTVGSKVFDAGVPSLTVAASGLYPHTDGYGVYAGRCPTNNPAAAPTSNASLLQSYTVGQGQTLATTPKVRMPSINIRLISGTSTNGTLVTSGATVFVRTADGCSSTYPSQTGTIGGALPEPGFPYGTYKLCAQATISGVLRHGHADVRSGGYAGSSSHVNDDVLNTAAGGNPTNTNTNGAIRIRLSQTHAQGCSHP